MRMLRKPQVHVVPIATLTMASKRSYKDTFEEFQTVSDVKHMSPKAKVYCVVSGIPHDMKQGSGEQLF